ncbi:hypothetical protein [Streptomyces sp. NBC_01264]|uniref:hypothetical protein n=1 Tax=Streptomyces sp. NBC_01264 TaxID=2903804 RepID=UPI002258F9CC|nr:hypothetical protein [Streptomyces sp. NBC_01264]MCX4778115.1 hypothetical protein [Streptomyces sp. NBC_01264]
MSFLGIVHPTGKHRAVDEVDRLRAQMRLLLFLLWWMAVQLTQAAAKASRCSVAEEQAAEATQRADALEREVTALRSQLANHRKTGNLTAHPAVAETQPIPIVSTSTNPPVYVPMRLSAAAEAGLL